MGLPKGYRKNIRLNRDKEGLERREEMLDEIADKGTRTFLKFLFPSFWIPCRR